MCGHQEPGLVCLGDLSPSCWPHWTVWPSDPPRTTLTWRQWSGISEFVFHQVAKIDFFILFFFFSKLTAEVRSQGHCCESCHSQWVAPSARGTLLKSDSCGNHEGMHVQDRICYTIIFRCIQHIIWLYTESCCLASLLFFNLLWWIQYHFSWETRYFYSRAAFCLSRLHSPLCKDAFNFYGFGTLGRRWYLSRIHEMYKAQQTSSHRSLFCFLKVSGTQEKIVEFYWFLKHKSYFQNPQNPYKDN